MENTLREYILNNWEQEWDCETRYFIILQNGDVIGYDAETELFYLNYYWNEISYDEAMRRLNRFAV
jgi:hypothetical protein